MNSLKIVVFDTGMGSKLFAQYFRQLHPDVEIETVIDKANSPYGNKLETEIFELTETAIKKHIGGVDAIVLACNTATAVAIDKLRTKYLSQMFVGFEPMIKTATRMTKINKIAVLATRATKQSDRYKRLKARFPKITIIEPNCDTWATQIDNGHAIELNALENQLDGADVLVLACTHYVAISENIQEVVGRQVKVINPFNAVTNYIVNKL